MRIPSFVMDRPPLLALADVLADSEELGELAAKLPGGRARVSEPGLPLVLAALHRQLGRRLVCLLPDDEDARAMLAALSGRVHQVYTGVAVARDGRIRDAVDVTAVTFSPLSSAEISAYVATGEPRDKAGAYAVQGRASRFIERLEGSYSSVVGLPVAVAYRLLIS